MRSNGWTRLPKSELCELESDLLSFCGLHELYASRWFSAKLEVEREHNAVLYC